MKTNIANPTQPNLDYSGLGGEPAWGWRERRADSGNFISRAMVFRFIFPKEFHRAKKGKARRIDSFASECEGSNMW
jgi:hypothetical protein